MKYNIRINDYIKDGYWTKKTIAFWNNRAMELECEFGIFIAVKSEYDKNRYLSRLYFEVNNKEYECADDLIRTFKMKEFL